MQTELNLRFNFSPNLRPTFRLQKGNILHSNLEKYISCYRYTKAHEDIFNGYFFKLCLSRPSKSGNWEAFGTTKLLNYV